MDIGETEVLPANSKKNSKRFYWKGKQVSEKIYNQRLKQQLVGMSNLNAVHSKKPRKSNLENTCKQDHAKESDNS